MSGAKARLAAAELLVTILDERRMLDEALVTSESYGRLTGPDRGFARAMASAALRQLGRIDMGLAPFLDRPLSSATPPARALLRVGAAQSWLMETPDHAVVGETVAAAKIWPRARRGAGFLNAVLRKVVADRSAFEAAPMEAIWPQWLRALFVDSVGKRASLSLAEAQTKIPETYIIPRDGNVVGLAKRLGLSGQAIVAEHTVRSDTSAVDTLEGYEAGDWWVQDVAATLPARLLDARPGETVLDMCAAPGGKTMQLAATGAKVTAIDRSKPRLKRLRENLKRTGFDGDVDVQLADVSQWQPPQPFDHILLDAPCSALGTLRRHPEGAWIKREADLRHFPAMQARLLDSALSMLKPGGTVIYCVCTPVTREGEAVVAEALKTHPRLSRVPIAPFEVPGFETAVTRAGDLLTLPTSSFGHDHFYISRLTLWD
ncbi:MAG: RsmB/NOP family class I SAM-dependent RNA methyltransferase [Pseudomonadota bacterium]